jgi:hypothetical protein
MSLLALQTGLRDWLIREEDAAPALHDPRFEAGLSVYLNNYRAQLMACLSESYGIVRAWLGDTAFEAAAATHIDRAPPKSWTLDAYGQDFPETLRALYPDDAEVGDLAALERALAQAFTADDVAPVDPAGLADLDWDRARLRFVPSLMMVPAASNAGAIWSAISADDMPPPAQRLATDTAILIWREGFTPAFRTLDPGEAEALDLLRQGADFGTLCARLVAQAGEAEGPAVAGAYLAQWIRDALVSDISSQPGKEIHNA